MGLVYQILICCMIDNSGFYCYKNITHLTTRGTLMTVSVCTWYEAGAQLQEIREQCEAIIRGDQPEKIEHLRLSEIKELFDKAAAIVTFCVASLEKRAGSDVDALKHRDYETYRYARQYARSLAHYLLHRRGLARRTDRLLEAWLDAESNRPSIRIEYVH